MKLATVAAPAAATADLPVDAGSSEELEAYRALLDRARKKTDPIPPEILVRHILDVTREGDWPVQREAMNALLRRHAAAREDRLEISSRPAGGAVLGIYATRPKGSPERPYRTLLRNVEPPGGSCDCPDFLRGSLGLCKHLLAILAEIFSHARLLQRTRAERPPPPGSPLRWDPVRPLRGAGDPLGQVLWIDGRPPAGTGRWFPPGDTGEWRLHDTHAEDPGRRLAVVLRLQELLADGRGDPALRALLAAERSRLEREIQDARTLPGVRDELRSLKQRLFPFQTEGVERFLERGRLLLADDMGLGKTAQAIAICHALFRAGRIRRGLLIVPAALKPQWLREWQIFTDLPARIVEGAPDDRREAFRCTRTGFLIANYEQLVRDLETMHGWAPDLVVLDEAQRMKNWATKTALYVKRLSPPYRLVLTGTPMENRIEELASIVEWVDDFAMEPKWRLVPWHATVVDGKEEIAGARNLDVLRMRLAGAMLRRRRQEVLTQLPPRTDTRVPVDMTPEQMEEHDALNKPIAALLSIAKKRPLTQAEFLRLMSLLTTQRIICNGLAQLRFEEVWPSLSGAGRPGESILRGLASPKLLELRELLRQVVLEQGRKVVVFSQWRRMLRLADWAVRDVLEEAGARAVFFTGEEGQKRRTHNIVDFHDDPACKVLFASDAGGVGLNLQRAANCVVNVELPWNPAVLEQRIGRIHRMGQKRPIDAYNLVSEGGIESRILFLVGAKQAFFQGLFDGSSDQVAFERSGTFLSRIEKLVTPSKPPPLPELPAEADEAAEREIDRIVAAAEESRDAPVPEPERPAPVPPADEVRRLFSELRVRPGEGGRVVIEASREAASMLGALLQGVAGLLQGVEAGR